MAAALAVAGPALAIPAVQIYAGYSDNNYDSTIFSIVVNTAITNGQIAGVGISGSGNGQTGVMTLGNLAAGTYSCVFNGGSCDAINGTSTSFVTSGAPFANDYDDFYSGDASYTFTANGLHAPTFSGATNLTGTFVPFLGNDSSGNELDQEIGFTLLSQTGAVPEPASWVLMIAGFGLIGGALRRRSTVFA